MTRAVAHKVRRRWIRAARVNGAAGKEWRALAGDDGEDDGHNRLGGPGLGAVPAGELPGNDRE